MQQRRRNFRNRDPLPLRPPPRGGGSGDGSGRTSGNSSNSSSRNSGNCAKGFMNPRNLDKGKAPVVPEAGSSSGPQHGHGASDARFDNAKLLPGARDHTQGIISSDFGITQRLGVDDQITLPQDGSSVRNNHIYSTIPCPPDAAYFTETVQSIYEGSEAFRLEQVNGPVDAYGRSLVI